ncbi:hypothetical protein [Rhizobium leguminosarum]|uniref:hypothetical protein n=1 Tax=Rhizobium leguminosarum TaxID=384 RepID=UPI002E124CAF|nr:hypothetical protein U8Q02_36890 [Rhizobium leguminosarum]
MTIIDKGMPRLLTKTIDGQPLKLVAGSMQLVGYLTWDSLQDSTPGKSKEVTIWPETLDYDDLPIYTATPRSNFVDEENTARQIASLIVQNDVLREGMRKAEIAIRDWISKPELDREALLGRLSLLLLQLDEVRSDHSKAHLLVGPTVPEQSGVDE